MAHPLDSARRKLNRADRHLRQLQAEIDAWLESDFYFIVQEDEPEVNRHFLRTRLRAQPDAEWGDVVGEAMNHARSALDHLVNRLIVANGKHPTRSALFPIYKREEDFDSRKISKVAARWQTEIRSLQPYTRGTGFAEHPLFRLNALVQEDKHRDTNPTVVGLVAPAPTINVNVLIGERQITSTAWRLVLRNWIGAPVDGAQLFGIEIVPWDPETRLQYHGELAFQVAFGQARATVSELRDLVRIVGVILTRFEPAFE